MANALLAAMAQPTLELHAAVARRYRPEARVIATHVAPLATPTPAARISAARDHALEMARAVAAAFNDIEALEVGAVVAPRPGFRDGDVVLVDWTGGTSGRVRARRQGSAVTLDVGDAVSAGPGVVFAVVRRVEAS